MSNKHKSSQFPKTNPNSTPKIQAVPPKAIQNTVSSIECTSQRVQPEQISLDAHAHIQLYLKNSQKFYLEQEELNAVLRLSQHLRIFGLLSAVGYINQSNDQEGKVRQRTVPIWQCLLGELIAPDQQLSKKQLMEKIIETTKKSPSEYMAMWRKSLILTHHWNFWARAYSKN
jgi:hypothetical protein